MPRHIAIIMDGNGRWAQKRGLPRAAGHQAGFRTTRDIVECCGRRQIEALTMFAFSSENWKRPATEVSWLMDLFLGALKSEVGKLHSNNVRIRFIGDRSAFSDKLQLQMDNAETLTNNNSGLVLSIAVNFGGRWDVINTTRQLAVKVAAGEIRASDIDDDMFALHSSLPDVPEPDLFIRTGGEKRISNFLLWHLAYTELYFCDIAWPDFDDNELEQAIQFYCARQRRFGQTGEQIEKADGGPDGA